MPEEYEDANDRQGDGEGENVAGVWGPGSGLETGEAMLLTSELLEGWEVYSASVKSSTEELSESGSVLKPREEMRAGSTDKLSIWVGSVTGKMVSGSHGNSDAI